MTHNTPWSFQQADDCHEIIDANGALVTLVKDQETAERICGAVNERERKGVGIAAYWNTGVLSKRSALRLISDEP